MTPPDVASREDVASLPACAEPGTLILLDVPLTPEQRRYVVVLGRAAGGRTVTDIVPTAATVNRFTLVTSSLKALKRKGLADRVSTDRGEEWSLTTNGRHIDALIAAGLPEHCPKIQRRNLEIIRAAPEGLTSREVAEARQAHTHRRGARRHRSLDSFTHSVERSLIAMHSKGFLTTTTDPQRQGQVWKLADLLRTPLDQARTPVPGPSGAG